MEANYNYKEWFTWDENESTKQMQIEGQQIEQKHCDTTTATQNELMPIQCKNTTKTKDSKKYFRQYNKQYYIKNKERIKQYYIDNKELIKQYNKQYRVDNKERIKQYNKQYNKQYRSDNKTLITQYRIDNKELIKQYNKQYYIDNKDGIKQYRIDNKEHKKIYYKQYRIANKDSIKRYKQNRRKTNIQFKLATNLRTRLYSAIRSHQKVGSAVKDLGCTIDEFKEYIESKFQSGMSWANWGRDGWHIDHIKPLSSFDLTNRQQFLEACHYTNLQPLWAEDNLSKSNRVVTLTE
jgi:hypothetical protein